MHCLCCYVVTTCKCKGHCPHSLSFDDSSPSDEDDEDDDEELIELELVELEAENVGDGGNIGC